MKLGITAHSLGVGHEPEALFEATARLAVCRRDAGSPPRGWWYTCVHE